MVDKESDLFQKQIVIGSEIILLNQKILPRFLTISRIFSSIPLKAREMQIMRFLRLKFNIAYNLFQFFNTDIIETTDYFFCSCVITQFFVPTEMKEC